MQFKGFLQTPPLWQKEEFLPFPPFITTAAIPRELKLDLEIPGNLVLGRRVEYYFRYYIEKFSHHKILAANLQVIQEKITLGELDFLLQNEKSKEISHVELVYKFYLYDPNFSIETDRWIGPNRRDTLVKKLKRLRDHQFPLLYRKETKESLNSLQIDAEEVIQKICFKAHLFLPYTFPDQKLPLINPECIAGRWLRAPEFTQTEFGAQLFHIPKKENWPVEPRYNETWFDFEQIQAQLQLLLSQKRAPMVWMKSGSNTYDRIFIVWW